AATKKPLANTSANTPASRHRMPVSDSSIRPSLGLGTPIRYLHPEAVTPSSDYPITHRRTTATSGFAVREKVCVDQVVDEGLASGLDLVELNAHPHPAVGPGDVSVGLDVPFGPRQAKAHLHLRVRIERARRSNRHAATAHVERQRRRDGVAESI